jgi:hypothetical protein
MVLKLYRTPRRHIQKRITLRSHLCLKVKSNYGWFVRSGDLTAVVIKSSLSSGM